MYPPQDPVYLQDWHSGYVQGCWDLTETHGATGSWCQRRTVSVYTVGLHVPTHTSSLFASSIRLSEEPKTQRSTV